MMNINKITLFSDINVLFFVTIPFILSAQSPSAPSSALHHVNRTNLLKHTESLETEVKILSWSIVSPGRADIVLPLPVDLNPKEVLFTLKEDSTYKVRFSLSVSNNIASGLRYINTVSRARTIVDRTEDTVGTLSPQLEPYKYETPEDTTPAGLVARSGSYTARTRFVDDEGNVYVDITYIYVIRRDWASI